MCLQVLWGAIKQRGRSCSTVWRRTARGSGTTGPRSSCLWSRETSWGSSTASAPMSPPPPWPRPPTSASVRPPQPDTDINPVLCCNLDPHLKNGDNIFLQIIWWRGRGGAEEAPRVRTPLTAAPPAAPEPPAPPARGGWWPPRTKGRRPRGAEGGRAPELVQTTVTLSEQRDGGGGFKFHDFMVWSITFPCFLTKGIQGFSFFLILNWFFYYSFLLHFKIKLLCNNIHGPDFKHQILFLCEWTLL